MSSLETGQMSAVETGQMSAAETGQMSAVETRQMLKSQIRGGAQNQQNGPKWVQNGRQASRIGQNESKHGSEAFPTGPGAKNPAKKARNLEICRSGPPLSGSTAQDLPDGGAPVQTGRGHGDGRFHENQSLQFFPQGATLQFSRGLAQADP